MTAVEVAAVEPAVNVSAAIIATMHVSAVNVPAMSVSAVAVLRLGHAAGGHHRQAGRRETE